MKNLRCLEFITVKFENINGKKTIELVNAYLPNNNQKELGGALRQYLNNEITREKLIQIIKNFLKNS